MTLARHSDIRLTMPRYIYRNVKQHVDALDRLPDPNGKEEKGEAATDKKSG